MGLRTERMVISPELKRRMIEAARGFRRVPTPSEAVLWRALRAGELGVKFRRQHPIGPFVVDFFCPSRHLIVEVDGPIHDGQAERDHERQALLEACGYRLLRFPAESVETDLDAVVTQIVAVLVAISPSPLEGEGAGGEGGLKQ